MTFTLGLMTSGLMMPGLQITLRQREEKAAATGAYNVPINVPLKMFSLTGYGIYRFYVEFVYIVLQYLVSIHYKYRVCLLFLYDT